MQVGFRFASQALGGEHRHAGTSTSTSTIQSTYTLSTRHTATLSRPVTPSHTICSSKHSYRLSSTVLRATTTRPPASTSPFLQSKTDQTQCQAPAPAPQPPPTQPPPAPSSTSPRKHPQHYNNKRPSPRSWRKTTSLRTFLLKVRYAIPPLPCLVMGLGIVAL